MSQALHQERLMTVIRGPHLSEKSAHCGREQPGCVQGSHRRDQGRDRQAVEMLFDVKVDGVASSTSRARASASAAYAGRRSDWKKAYVKLAEGSEIDFLGGE